MKNFILGAILVVALLGGGYVIWQNQMTGTVTPETVTNADGTVTNPDGTVQPAPGGTTVVIDNSAVPGKPIATTNATVAPTDTTAVVTGSVMPAGAITAYWYEYGTTKDLGTKTAVQVAGSGYTVIPTPGYITGLTKNTTYYFRLVAQNSVGSVFGETKTVTTSSTGSAPVGGLPSATTLAASGITSTSATLKGSVNPNKAPTQYWFEIGKNNTLGGVTTITSIGDGSAALSASVIATPLEAGTTYYYRINAQNQYGTVNGAILTFKTGGSAAQVPSVAPVVTTQVASAITTSGALVSGTVNPYGTQTSYWFEYSTNSNFSQSNTTQKKSAGAVSTTVTVQATLSGLKTKTTYFVRIVAQNSGGTVKGDSQTFLTK